MRREDFYTNKQLEYISYYTRSKIYQRSNDKKKFNEICEKIKSTIEDYSIRNRVDSIFTSETMRTKYLNLFFRDRYGLPNFQYRDEYQMKWKGLWDKKYWYCKGCKVFIEGDNEEWTIKYINADSNFVIVEKGYETKRLNFDKVKREFEEF